MCLNVKIKGRELSLLAFLPLLVLLIPSVGFTATLMLSRVNNHTTFVEFPYISETGSNLPESTIFTFACGLSSFGSVLVTMIRFYQIKSSYDNHTKLISTLNILTLIIGLMSAFGLLLVASFQAKHIYPGVAVFHYIGALLVYGGGTLYSCIHVLLTHLSKPRLPYTPFFIVLRSALCIAMIVFFLTTLSGSIVYGTKNSHLNSTYHELPVQQRPYYGWFLLSTVSEWLMSISYVLYIASFTRDFWYYKVRFYLQHVKAEIESIALLEDKI